MASKLGIDSHGFTAYVTCKVTGYIYQGVVLGNFGELQVGYKYLLQINFFKQESNWFLIYEAGNKFISFTLDGSQYQNGFNDDGLLTDCDNKNFLTLKNEGKAFD